MKICILIAKARYYLIAFAVIINIAALITAIKNGAGQKFILLPFAGIFLAVVFPVSSYIIKRFKF